VVVRRWRGRDHGGTARCAAAGWGRPCGRSPGGPRSRSSSMSPRSRGSRNRSRWRRITSSPKRSPTRRGTRTRRLSRWTRKPPAARCGCVCVTTVSAASTRYAARGWSPYRGAGWHVLHAEPGGRRHDGVLRASGLRRRWAAGCRLWPVADGGRMVRAVALGRFPGRQSWGPSRLGQPAKRDRSSRCRQQCSPAADRRFVRCPWSASSRWGCDWSRLRRGRGRSRSRTGAGRTGAG
jgi:hypothetical protein